jgi:peptidoglycan/xylan/chitin deacetylase (PgdA/CDA1 family)
MKKFLPLIFLIIGSNLVFGQTSLRYRVTPWSDNKKAAVTVTLDDNCDGQFIYAVPTMNARNIKGTFFIITGDGSTCDGATNWPAYVNAASYGHEVTAHTVTHPDLTTLSSTQINYEMSTSQNTIIQMVPGAKSQTFAYPYGAGGGSAPSEVNVRTIAHNYFIGARGAGVNSSGFDEYNDYRNTAFQDYYFQVESYEVGPWVDITTFKNIINALIIDGGWFIPQYHGIQTSGYDLITSSAFTAQMDALSAKSSSLWLATFAQTLKYHKEHDSHNLVVVSEDASAWRLNLTDNLPNASFDQPLTIRLKSPSWVYTSITQGTKTLSVITDGDTLQFNAVPDGGNIIFNKGVTGPSIATNAISGSPFCAGAPVIVPFTVNGTFNSGNVFTAQLSSSTGSFTTPVNIGTLTGIASSSISANLPGNVAAGNSYRIRVVSSSPAVTGTDNGTNIIINSVPAPVISISSTVFCSGGSVVFNANTATGLTYQWIKDGANLSGATSPSYTASLPGTYSVKETNSAGCSSTSAGISITQNTNCMSIGTNSITGSPFCAGASITVPFTASGTFNSDNIFTAQLSSSTGSFTTPVNIGSFTGTSSGSISANLPANSVSGSAYRIRVISSSPVVTGTDNGTNIIINSVPVASISSGSTTFCTGSSIILNANTGTGLTYQWIKDGANISGATASAYTASLAGIYSVKETNSASCASTSAGLTITESTNCAHQAQTITFPAIPNKTFTSAPFRITATASSGLPVSFSILSGPATISKDTVKVTGVGTVVVRASQAGNATYDPAPNVDNSFTVSQASQSIVFPVIPNKQLTDPPFTVNASASSGLPITFSIVSGPATISGNTITLTKVAGTVTVRATQAGNINYLSATATQSFTVGKLSQTINFPQIPDHEALDDPFQLKATASSGLPVTFEILYGPADIEGDNYVYLWEEAGQVGVRATQAGNAQYAAVHVDQSFYEYVGSRRLGADSTLLSGGTPMELYSVYPNPAHDMLKIKFDKAENIENYTYSLQAGSGQKIDGISFTHDKVTNEVEVDIRLLAPGIYYLFIFDGKKTKASKILKE